DATLKEFRQLQDRDPDAAKKELEAVWAVHLIIHGGVSATSFTPCRSPLRPLALRRQFQAAVAGEDRKGEVGDAGPSSAGTRAQNGGCVGYGCLRSIAQANTPAGRLIETLPKIKALGWTHSSPPAALRQIQQHQHRHCRRYRPSSADLAGGHHQSLRVGADSANSEEGRCRPTSGWQTAKRVPPSWSALPRFIPPAFLLLEAVSTFAIQSVGRQHPPTFSRVSFPASLLIKAHLPHLSAYSCDMPKSGLGVAELWQILFLSIALHMLSPTSSRLSTFFSPSKAPLAADPAQLQLSAHAYTQHSGSASLSHSKIGIFSSPCLSARHLPRIVIDLKHQRLRSCPIQRPHLSHSLLHPSPYRRASSSISSTGSSTTMRPSASRPNPKRPPNPAVALSGSKEREGCRRAQQLRAREMS
ncbi:hypothetical protein A4X03_0g7782, partial [Tilletia caries]